MLKGRIAEFIVATKAASGNRGLVALRGVELIAAYRSYTLRTVFLRLNKSTLLA